jgi:hypothetical protein
MLNDCMDAEGRTPLEQMPRGVIRIKLHVKFPLIPPSLTLLRTGFSLKGEGETLV